MRRSGVASDKNSNNGFAGVPTGADARMRLERPPATMMACSMGLTSGERGQNVQLITFSRADQFQAID